MQMFNPNDPEQLAEYNKMLEKSKHEADLHNMKHEAAYREITNFMDGLSRDQAALMYVMLSGISYSYSCSKSDGITVMQRWLGNLEHELRVVHNVPDATNQHKLIDIIIGDEETP